MRIGPDQTAVVAGNGPSLCDIPAGVVLEDDVILRTNSFFFEPEFYLGRRVDLAVFGGDPRVAPFVFETLWRCREDYRIGGWSSPDPRVEKAGMRRFRALFHPMRLRDAAIGAEVAALCEKYGRVPTTGVQAVLLAHGLGAARIVIAGIDLYQTGQRYPYMPGRHYRDLMGANVGKRGADLRLHHPDLDRAVLAALNARDDVDLSTASNTAAFDDLMARATPRPGTPPAREPRTPPADWADWAGAYPIGLLKLMRRASAWRRQILRARA